MKSLFCLAPAKINLTLQVLRKREDRYHEIYSLFQKVSLFDELEIERERPSFELIFECDEEIELEKNLLYKAWRLFKNTFQVKEEIKIWVKKRIPLGAGLGGGSSNAGTLLKNLAKLYEIERAKLFPIAVSLGADVPFFLEDLFAAEATGIGEILKPFPSFSAYYLLLYPGFKIDTAWAYHTLNLTKEKNPIKYEASLPPWEKKEGLLNDFKGLLYKKYPLYEDLERALKEVGAKGVSISGTGSTLFGVFEKLPTNAYLRLKKFLKGGKIFLVKNLNGSGGN